MLRRSKHKVSPVVETYDVSLVGMAEFLRDYYKIPTDKAVLCRNPVTGEHDVSWSKVSDP